MEFEKIKSQVNKWFEDYFDGKGTYNKKLYEAMYYSIKVGGKRIRPILMLLTYSMYKNDYKNVMPLACAIEMIHTYSLIHDDLPCMDDDNLRRGKPTNHKKFGEGTAVLAGDALLNEAMNIMFKYCIKNKNAIYACEVISRASGTEGMIGGQIVDILSENKKISYNELEYMYLKKTGALIEASIVAGALIAKAPKEDIEKLSLFGRKLGFAFQIKDDILDVTGDLNLLGKDINSDLQNNKNTFVSHFGIDKSKEKCFNLTNECIDILSRIKANTNNLRAVTKFLLKRDY